jgi:hypothetical protein
MSTVEKLTNGSLAWGKITLARDNDSEADAAYFYEDDKIRIDLALDDGEWSVYIETGHIACGVGRDEASALADGFAKLREILRETEATIQEVLGGTSHGRD